jgi:hypothetical protein
MDTDMNRDSDTNRDLDKDTDKGTRSDTDRDKAGNRDAVRAWTWKRKRIGDSLLKDPYGPIVPRIWIMDDL